MASLTLVSGAFACQGPPPGDGSDDPDAALSLRPAANAALSPRPAADERAPNVLIIFVDDMGVNDIGANGSTLVRTPHLDSIAERGVRCTAGYVTAPQCSPSRAGLLTGRYQQRFGHEANPEESFRETFGLPTEELTIGDHLQTAGYETAAVGKWDLGRQRWAHPTNRGFDYFYGFLVGARSYAPTNTEVGHIQLSRGPDPEDYVHEYEYLTDQLTEGALEIIRYRARPERPLLLYLSYNAPHSPYDAPDEYLSRNATIDDEDRRTYAAMITALDDGVGRVLAELEGRGELDNTLVIFLSDNGAPGPGEDGFTVGSNDPLRGVKGTLFEGGIRVPFFVQWTASSIPAGSVYEQPVSALDIVSTALAAAHRSPPAGLDGTDLLPYLDGSRPEPPHPDLYWRWMGHLAAREGDFKWTRKPDGTEWLFDLGSDPTEAHDLTGERPELAAELRDNWQRWNQELTAPLWLTEEESAWLAELYGE